MSVGAMLAPWGKDPCLRFSEMRGFALPHGAKIVPTKIAILILLLPHGAKIMYAIFVKCDSGMFCFAPWGETCSRRNRDFGIILRPMGRNLFAQKSHF